LQIIKRFEKEKEASWNLSPAQPTSSFPSPYFIFRAAQPYPASSLCADHVAAQRSQQRQHMACTSPTDSLHPPRNDEAESELELKTPPGKISPTSNPRWKWHRILTEKHVGLESAAITSTRMETPINRNRFRSDIVHPKLKP
jgi:hypothetical protein